MEPSSTSGTLPFDPFSVIVSSPATETVANFTLPPSSTAALSTPAATSTRPTQGFSATPTPGLGGFSPSPSPPAQPGFNPDDFFASPPQPQASPADPARFTPELKRRLFGPADPLRSAPSTARKPNPSSSLGLTTPIPTTTFANPLSNDGSDDGDHDIGISPTFSPGRALIGDVVPPPPQPPQPDPQPQHHQQQESQHHAQPTQTFQPFHAKELATVGVTLPHRGPPALPGTPFTPVVTQHQRTKCSCKASKCLKLYCPCFASSGFCGPDCTCKNCQNTHLTAHSVHEARETVLARDPRAFEPKVRNSLATASGDIHIKGCNCRKGCGKNYCVCRELRVDCGPRCTCSGPNGCLNGKSDALEDHQFKGKAEHILGAGKSRPTPADLNGGFPPIKTSRVRPCSGIRLKHERKRQKRDLPPNVTASPDEIGNVLSPSFPSFSFSPVTGLKGNIEDFRRVLQSGEGLSSALSLPKGSQEQPTFTPTQQLDFKEERKGTVLSETPSNSTANPTAILTSANVDTLPHQISSQVTAGPSESEKAPGSPARPPTGVDDKENVINGQNDEETNQEQRQQLVNKKCRPSPVKLETEFDEAANESHLLDSEKQRTPERRRLATDIEEATSPATGEKDAVARTWANLRGNLFGKEEKIEVCRLPRILRVKMGSGRLLRKFEM